VGTNTIYYPISGRSTQIKDEETRKKSFMSHPWIPKVFYFKEKQVKIHVPLRTYSYAEITG